MKKGGGGKVKKIRKKPPFGRIPLSKRIQQHLSEQPKKLPVYPGVKDEVAIIKALREDP